MLRTNAKVTPLQAVLRYRDLPQVENLFLRTKAIMRTRPIFHSSDATIRGHVFCSFLALAMQKHLDGLSREAGATPEWKFAKRTFTASSKPPSQLWNPATPSCLRPIWSSSARRSWRSTPEW